MVWPKYTENLEEILWEFDADGNLGSLDYKSKSLVTELSDCVREKPKHKLQTTCPPNTYMANFRAIVKF